MNKIMPKVGDQVRYLNNVGGGVIVRIVGQTAWVEDDGFENPVLLRECVVVGNGAPAMAKTETPTPSAPANVASPCRNAKATVAERDYVADSEETEYGDRLTVVLGFEPVDRSRFSESDFNVTLINDSNYFLGFVLLVRDEKATEWTTKYSATVEPNTELWLGKLKRNELVFLDAVRLQYVAYKEKREFEAKSPGDIELKVDNTKFCRLHCFKPNPYFDNDVLAFTFIENDKVPGQPVASVSDMAKLENSLSSKGQFKGKETKSAPKRDIRHKKQGRTGDNSEPLVVDLHIAELVDTTVGMSPADMLNLQVDTFQKIMDENLHNYGKKIIFIHGKGEGVLRQALTKELNHRYRGHDVQDASFREYGFGATQVTIRRTQASSKK